MMNPFFKKLTEYGLVAKDEDEEILAPEVFEKLVKEESESDPYVRLRNIIDGYLILSVHDVEKFKEKFRFSNSNEQVPEFLFEGLLIEWDDWSIRFGFSSWSDEWARNITSEIEQKGHLYKEVVKKYKMKKLFNSSDADQILENYFTKKLDDLKKNEDALEALQQFRNELVEAFEEVLSSKTKKQPKS